MSSLDFENELYLNFFGEIVASAREDAQNGNLEALVWLAVFAIPLTREIFPGFEHNIFRVCREIWQRIKSGEIEPDYQLKFFERRKGFYQKSEDALVKILEDDSQFELQDGDLTE